MNKNNNNNNNIISMTGRKVEEENTDIAKLELDGKTHELKSFIVSGSTPEGKRLLFTWNASLDEIISYNYVLNMCVEDKVREALTTSPPPPHSR